MNHWFLLAAAVVGVACVERWRPARPESIRRTRRIAANVGRYVLNGLLGAVSACWDLFVHANVQWPRRLSAALGSWLMTPTLHAVHHSAVRAEADSSYGGVLVVWDRLFGTARQGEPAPLRVGIEHEEPSAEANVVAMLLLPFRGTARPSPPKADASTALP